MGSDAAIVLDGVGKSFRKSAIRREYSTLKTELVRLIRRPKRVDDPEVLIEALRHVDLTIPKGKTVGIIGRNGSGKSTLLKLITGIHSPSKGTVKVTGRISALLELGAGFHPDFTGRENILINGIILGMSRSELKARTPEIISFAELGDFIDEPVRTYSSGMFMRLAFAVATHVDPDILIIDEILSVGDEHFSRKSHARMNEFKATGKTIVLVTHSLDTVQTWCDLAVWLDAGRVRQVGEPSTIVAAYRQAVAAAEAAPAATSALRAPGLELPQVPEFQSVAAGLKLTALEAVALETQVELRMEYQASGAMTAPLTVQLLSAGGRVAFASTLALDAAEAGQGRARWAVPRGSLAPGTYQAVVQAADGVKELRAELVLPPGGERCTPPGWVLEGFRSAKAP